MTPLFEVENLHFHYTSGRDEIFNEVTFLIEWKDRILLRGPNGCGKSTLLKLLAGLLSPQKGSIRRLGKENPRLDASLFKRVFFLQQSTAQNLFGLCPGHDAEIWSLASESSIQWKDLLDRDPVLRRKADDPFSRLSGGELQAFSLLWLSAFSERFWILDEPTAGLDQSRKRNLFKLLEERKEGPAGMLVTSQDAALDPALFDRQLTIAGGKIVEERP
jgi:ABC-type multidrug transport system ATPase subunit